MRDPYSVLNVAKSASEKDIKSAYRKLAKIYHPDKNKDDPKAKAKFNEVSSAYDLLSNKEKRAQFDRGEIDAQGNPKYAGFDFGQKRGGARPQGNAQAGGFNSEDILREFMSSMGGAQAGGSPFGGGQQGARQAQSPFGGAGAKAKDYTANAHVSLEEVNRGASVNVLLPGGKSLAVKLPKGAKDGQQIRLKGQGEQNSYGGPAGDAIISVKYKKHKKFRIDGNDLKVDVPIALYEAVLGAKVRVPTLGGEVELNIPKGIDTLKSLRLKGKGLFGDGDILVNLRIVLPKESDPDLESLMKFWRDQKPYDVRG